MHSQSPEGVEPQYSTLAVHVGFGLSGVVIVIAMQWEDYHGLGGNSRVPLSHTTALPVLPTFAANLIATAWLFRGWPGRRMYDRKMWLLCAFALVGEAANQASIILAGSLTFTVVYSSVTLWTAFLGVPVLGTSPNRTQWMAICCIVIGLLASAASHTSAKEGANGWNLVTGAACGLIGSLSYAMMYVTTELIQRESDSPPPEALCAFVGLVCSTAVGGYIAIWDGPRWSHLVEEELTASYGQIVTVYAFIVVFCFWHNLMFYYLTRLSAVLAGVNKAVQAVSTFGASHLFFCAHDPQQCLTAPKVINDTPSIPAIYP
jgi:drug/metabolite transporter (DMT)-like permease